jgi:hypothetical protein
VNVTVPGGAVGRYTWKMTGAPVLHVGDRAVFFLKRDAANLWRPVGLSMGVYPIRPSTSGSAGVVDPPVVSSITADSGPIVRGDSRRRVMTVADFESLVQLVIAAPQMSAAPTSAGAAR